MSKCDSCKFRESSMYPWKCNYISIIGHSRGCEPGNACTEYQKGDRITLEKFSSFRYYNKDND